MRPSSTATTLANTSKQTKTRQMSFLNETAFSPGGGGGTEGIDGASSERRRRPRNTNILDNIDDLFDSKPQKRLGDVDKVAASFNASTELKSHRASATTEIDNPAFDSKPDNIFDEGSGILSQASSRKAGRRAESNAPGGVVTSAPKPKIDDFEDFDLGDMLGLGDERPKKQIVSAPTARPFNNNNNSSEGDDLPSFLRDSNATASADGRKRGRGGLGLSSPPQAAVDLFAGVSDQSRNAILSSSLDPSKSASTSMLQRNEITTSKPSILDILDKKPTKPISIFDILDKKPPTDVPSPFAPEKKNSGFENTAVAKKNVVQEAEDSDSLSSIASLSDTDESELLERLPSKKSLKKEASKSDVKDDLISKLQDQLKKAEEEASKAKKDLDDIKAIAEKEKIDLKASLEEKSTLHDTLQTELNKSKDQTLLLQKQVDATKAEYEMKLAQEMQLQVQKMSDAMTNAEGVSKLHGLVTQVRETTQKMDMMQSLIQETTNESLKAREAAVSMKEVHLARIEDELQNSSRQIQQERKKIEHLMLDVHDDKKLAELKRQQMEEKLEQESMRLKNELEIVQKTKDSLMFALNQEKESFRLQKEQWNVERTRLLDQVHNDKKEISMLKPMLESQKNAARVLELEWKDKTAHERNQIEAERRILETDQKELSYKQRLLHREEASLKTERLKLEEKEREVESMTSVYQKEMNDLQQKFLRISRMRDEAASENAEAQKIREVVDAMQKNLEAKHAQCQEDLNRLSSTKKSYIDQRINKSYLLQDAMLQYPLLRNAHIAPAAAPVESTRPRQTERQLPVHAQNFTAHVSEAPIEQQTQAPTAADQITRYKWSEAERDLAAALELQLGSYISKLNQGHSKRKLSYQRIVVNRTKLGK